MFVVPPLNIILTELAICSTSISPLQTSPSIPRKTQVIDEGRSLFEDFNLVSRFL